MAQASHKTRKKSSARRSRPIPGWVWLLAGLAIGLSIAFFTATKDRAAPPPLPTAPPKQDHGAAGTKAESNKPAKTSLDFYTTLPKMELIVPETYAKPGQTVPPGVYILQVGSFRSFDEADRLKAQLALLGIESRIEAVAIDNADSWHRVRVGPTQDLRELNKIRTRLLNNNISAILLRVNG